VLYTVGPRFCSQIERPSRSNRVVYVVRTNPEHKVQPLASVANLEEVGHAPFLKSNPDSSACQKCHGSEIRHILLVTINFFV
jgi:hypothetical protein